MLRSLAPVLALAAFSLAAAIDDEPIYSTLTNEQTGVITDLDVDPKEKILFSCAENGEVRAWDMKKNEFLWSVSEGLASVGISAGDETVGTAPPVMVTVTQFDAQSGERLAAIGGPSQDTASCVFMTPDDQWAWVGTIQGTLWRLTPSDVDAWSRRAMKNNGITCLEGDSKGKLLAVGGEDGTIRFVNPKSATRDEKKIFEGHEEHITALSFDAGGKMLASASEDGVIRLWTASSGKEKLVIEAGSAIRSVELHPKAKWVAGGDENGKVRIWSAKKGELLLTLDTESGTPVWKLIALDKGKQLAATDGKAVRIWTLPKL